MRTYSLVALCATPLLVSCGDGGRDEPAHDATATRFDAGRSSSSDASHSLDAGVDPPRPDVYVESSRDAQSEYLVTDASCTTGLDCPSGYCSLADPAEVGVCYEHVPGALANEKCNHDSDCYQPGSGARPVVCVGGFCGVDVDS